MEEFEDYWADKVKNEKQSLIDFNEEHRIKDMVERGVWEPSYQDYKDYINEQ